MIYSCWNQALGAFDYFESSHESPKLNVEKPNHLVSRTLGATPDQAAWPLPGNLRRIGSGPDAIGRVATIKRAGSLSGDDEGSSGIAKASLLAISGYLLWRYMVKPQGRRA
jgi:hypothetical protein